jgi:signal transduction histidine kinase
MQKSTYSLVIFLIIVSVLIITMMIFIISIIYAYRKKQFLMRESIHALKLQHDKIILDTRLEIQEQTFQHIGREIHDNINLSLTLTKLNLNTLIENSNKQNSGEIKACIGLITKAILDLSNISRSLNSDLIIQQGLIQAVNEEIKRIRQVSSFTIDFKVTGEPVFLNAQKELIIFRIIQEAFNNILKHANASFASLNLNYIPNELTICIEDDGKGFIINNDFSRSNLGLKNMESRTKALEGVMELSTIVNEGTTLIFRIPYHINNG